MKITFLTLLTIITTSLVRVVSAQELKASVYTDVTGYSYATGTSVGFLLPGFTGDIEIGAFYERSNSILNDNEFGVDVIEKNFKGVNTSFSILAGQSFDFAFNLKAGIEGQQRQVLLLPAFSAEYLVTDRIGVGAAAVMHGFIPSAQVKVSVLAGGSSTKRMKRRIEYAVRRSHFQEQREAYRLARN